MVHFMLNTVHHKRVHEINHRIFDFIEFDHLAISQNSCVKCIFKFTYLRFKSGVSQIFMHLEWRTWNSSGNCPRLRKIIMFSFILTLPVQEKDFNFYNFRKHQWYCKLVWFCVTTYVFFLMHFALGILAATQGTRSIVSNPVVLKLFKAATLKITFENCATLYWYLATQNSLKR